VPTVTAFTNVNFTLSLLSDPISGPFTSSFNTTAGIAFTLRLTQATPTPATTVCLSFGDGSSLQNVTLTAGAYLNITYNYTTGGSFKIVATPIMASLNYTVVNNNITVNVAGPTVYQGKLFFV
jgi:hypothetical protein